MKIKGSAQNSFLGIVTGFSLNRDEFKKCPFPIKSVQQLYLEPISSVLRRSTDKLKSFLKKPIEYIKEYGVELVLLDMVMNPGIDGLETYRNIKELQADLRVLIVSGYCENERMDQAFALGVRGFIKKPYTVLEIASKVKNEFVF